MKSSSLAECVEAYDASVLSLRRAPAPANRTMLPLPGDVPPPAGVVRRTPRTSRIQIRDQGLRPFRVC